MESFTVLYFSKLYNHYKVMYKYAILWTSSIADHDMIKFNSHQVQRYDNQH
jgi:hypothetical protein